MMEAWLLVIYIMSSNTSVAVAIVQKPYMGWAVCKEAADAARRGASRVEAFCIPAP